MGLQEPVHVCVDQGSHSDWENFPVGENHTEYWKTEGIYYFLVIF